MSNTKAVKFIFPDELEEIERIAKKLDHLSNDLMDAGVCGYALSLKKEAEILRSIAEGSL